MWWRLRTTGIRNVFRIASKNVNNSCGPCLPISIPKFHGIPDTAFELQYPLTNWHIKKKGSLYSITERRVPELISVLGSQPASDVSHKPGGTLPLLSARLAVTPTTLWRAATNFAAR